MQAPILSKLDGPRAAVGAKSNTDQDSANKGGASAPRIRSLIAARSIMAMRQDQTCYGTTTLTVGPRANAPLSSAHYHTPGRSRDNGRDLVLDMAKNEN